MWLNPKVYCWLVTLSWHVDASLDSSAIDEKRNAKELCDGTKLTPFEDEVVDIH